MIFEMTFFNFNIMSEEKNFNMYQKERDFDFSTKQTLEKWKKELFENIPEKPSL